MGSQDKGRDRSMATGAQYTDEQIASLPGWSRARRNRQKRDDIPHVRTETKEIHGHTVTVKIYKRGRGNIPESLYGLLKVDLSLAALRAHRQELTEGRYYERFYYDYDDPASQMSEVGSDKYS